MIKIIYNCVCTCVHKYTIIYIYDYNIYIYVAVWILIQKNNCEFIEGAHILFAIYFWECNYLRLLPTEKTIFFVYFLICVNDHVTFYANYKILRNDEYGNHIKLDLKHVL